jgi:hypothetical protein
MLGRDTKWRQGGLLTHRDALKLGLVQEDQFQLCGVVISHDCDLANEKEEAVEIIVASIADKLDAMLARARNVRRLHLTFEKDGIPHLVLELSHAERRLIGKALFAGVGGPDTELVLGDDEKRALKQWLAARYGRPAFPNAFEHYLRKKVGKRGVEQWIARILESCSLHLVGLFFDLGFARGIDLPEGVPYDLRILVVYDAIEGSIDARKAAEGAAAEIGKLFVDAFGKPEDATEIAIDSCTAVADTQITLADLRRVDQWRVEHISLREDPVGAFLAVGEQPA